MNWIEATKLMLRPELWERPHKEYTLFDDELQLIDGNLRFFSDEAVRFREKEGQRIVYEVPFFAWLFINPLARRLLRQVCERERTQLKGKAT